MRIVLSSLLILAHLLCFSLPSAALDTYGTDVGLQINDRVTGDSGSSGTTKVAPWASLEIPSYIIEGLRHVSLPPALRLTGAINTFMGPQPSPSDFWEKAKELEQLLQDYVPRLLGSAAQYFSSAALPDIAPTINNIVRPTAAFRDSIQGALDAQNITLDALTEELEFVFMAIVEDMQNVPPPSEAPGHAERIEMVVSILDDTELALINLATRYGIEDKVVSTYVDALKPQVLALIVTVGDINEQHPELLPMLVFSVAALLVPEYWILRPFLSVFGFGPAGPVKGSAAAWMQRRFWGAAVRAGSWFSWLQAAGMGHIPKWGPPVLGGVISVPLLIVLLLLFCCCCCC